MPNKYNDLMQKVNVTPEARQRILQNLEAADTSAQEQNQKQKSTSPIVFFARWKSTIALAACAAVLLVGAFALPSVLRGDDLVPVTQSSSSSHRGNLSSDSQTASSEEAPSQTQSSPQTANSEAAPTQTPSSSKVASSEAAHSQTQSSSQTASSEAAHTQTPSSSQAANSGAAHSQTQSSSQTASSETTPSQTQSPSPAASSKAPSSQTPSSSQSASSEAATSSQTPSPSPTPHSFTLYRTPDTDSSGDDSPLLGGVPGGVSVHTYETRSQLESAVGFTVEGAAYLPFGTRQVEYTAYWGSLAQIEYTGAYGQTACWRKSRGNTDNSSTPLQPEQTETFTLGSFSVTLQGTADGYSLAWWTDGQYSYSLALSESLTRAEWQELLGRIT